VTTMMVSSSQTGRFGLLFS